MLSDLAAKRLALLKEAVPGISHVLVLSYLVDPIAPLQVKALQEASRTLGVTLQVHEIRTADGIPVAFEAGAKDRADGLVITGESIFTAWADDFGVFPPTSRPADRINRRLLLVAAEVCCRHFWSLCKQVRREDHATT
jgi:hypothetical protein